MATAALQNLEDDECTDDDQSSPGDLDLDSINSISEADSAGTAGVRPMPVVSFRGRFAMCTRKHCRAEYCTFAHSEEELRAWNTQKLGGKKRQRKQRKENESERSGHPMKRSLSPQRVQEDDECTDDDQSSPGDLDLDSINSISEADSAGTAGVRPMPVVSFHGCFAMCTGKHCRGKYCTFAHSEEELRAWNTQKLGGKKRQRKQRKENESERSGHPTKWSLFRQRVQNELVIEDIEERLTLRNYKDKFHKLLCWEEGARANILASRCDGEYTLVLYKDGTAPNLLHRGIRDYHTHFGFLMDVPGDLVSRIVQFSERAIITARGKCSVTADVLPENYSHIHNRLYLAFDDKSGPQLVKATGNSNSIEILAEFDLTHRYFDSLHDALDAMNDKVVLRLMPSEEDFSSPLRRLNKIATLCDGLQMDNGLGIGEQTQALRTALIYPQSDPPVLIQGAFGTGKSRVLAAAACHIIMRENQVTARVLLCSNQASADLCIEKYFAIVQNHPSQPCHGVAIVRLIPPFKEKGSYRLMCKTVDECAEMLRTLKRVIVVTSYNTAADLRGRVPHGYITHMLLDEAAQMTEPEALWPLSMATIDTTIILAGDICQIRPAVSGDEAGVNGLGMSLFERLYNWYREIGPQATTHISALEMCYRCHDDILTFLSGLFYNNSVQCCASLYPTHPLTPYPLVFVCTSLNPVPPSTQEDTDTNEASLLVQQVVRYVEPWPEVWGDRDLTTVCITVSCRRQVAVVKNAVAAYKHLGLNNANISTTYNLPGQEFRAIFIGTSEPISESGESLNPTKSMCNPFIFNTALTRAMSLVVVLGNPLVLLRMKSAPPCWREYLKLCLDHDTILTPTAEMEEEWLTDGKDLLMKQLYTP